MGFIEEVKKELKEFYEKQVKVFVEKTKAEFNEFFQKTKTQIKAVVQQILIEAAQRRARIWQAINRYWDYLTGLYFKYLHPTLVKYWRKLVYLWIVCKHYGKRFIWKVWARVVIPVVRTLYKIIKFILLEILVPTVKKIYQGGEFIFKQVVKVLRWTSSQVVQGLINLGRLARWFGEQLINGYQVLERLVVQFWQIVIEQILDFTRKLIIRCLTEIFKVVRYLWINMVSPFLKLLGRVINKVIHVLSDIIWWAYKQVSSVVRWTYHSFIRSLTYIWDTVCWAWKVIDKIVRWVYPYLAQVVTYVWDKICLVIKEVVRGLRLFWEKIVVQLFYILKNGLVWFLEKVCRPIFNFLVRAWDNFWELINYLFREFIKLVEQVYQYIIKPVFNFVKLILEKTYDLLVFITRKILQDLEYAFNQIIKFVRYVYDQVVKPLYDLLARVAKEIFKYLEFVFKRIVEGWNYLIQLVVRGFNYTVRALKNSVFFARDCLYVTLGLPIYIYKRVTKPK